MEMLINPETNNDKTGNPLILIGRLKKMKLIITINTSILLK